MPINLNHVLPLYQIFCLLCNRSTTLGKHHHAIPKLNRETLHRYVDNVTNLLEKSFVHRNSFSVVLDMIEKLVESCAKYSVYLEDNLTHVSDFQSQEEPEEITNLIELPEYSSESVQELYTSKRDRDLVEIIRHNIESADDYEAVNIDEYLKGHAMHRYRFLKKLKNAGLGIHSVILYEREYHPGKVHFLWKEEPSEKNNLTKRQYTISSLQSQLPKYFSRSHKAKSRHLLSLLMADKMCASEFRAIYAELTGDCSVADNTKLKEVDDRMRLIMKTADPSIIRDLRVNNSRKAKYHNFWDVAEKKIEELQAAAVDDRRHSDTQDSEVISYMALVISVRDLYEQCVSSQWARRPEGQWTN